MTNLVLSPIDPEILINKIAEKVVKELQTIKEPEPELPGVNNPFEEFIPKSEIRGVFASASTLWKWEKEGKITSYAIGGKRYYKRDDIADLFTEVKQQKPMP